MNHGQSRHRGHPLGQRVKELRRCLAGCCAFWLGSRLNPLTALSGDGTFSGMDAKPTVEQFIGDCFRERTATLKKVLEIRRDYRERFYNSECLWDSRCGAVEDSEEREDCGRLPYRIGTDVITTGSCTYCARYRVRPSGENWLIHDVEIKCGRCQLKGADPLCAMCGGTDGRAQNSAPLYVAKSRRATF